MVFTELSPPMIIVASLACIVVFAWGDKIITSDTQFTISL